MLRTPKVASVGVGNSDGPPSGLHVDELLELLQGWYERCGPCFTAHVPPAHDCRRSDGRHEVPFAGGLGRQREQPPLQWALRTGHEHLEVSELTLARGTNSAVGLGRPTLFLRALAVVTRHVSKNCSESAVELNR